MYVGVLVMLSTASSQPLIPEWRRSSTRLSQSSPAEHILKVRESSPVFLVCFSRASARRRLRESLSLTAPSGEAEE
ncbi:MAG: hypothetical protein ACI39U_05080 [Candidatus Cryptobacteroides sp.]